MGEVGFNRNSDHWLDVAVFEEKAGRILRHNVKNMAAKDALDLEKTLELCKGELLEGFYEEWALRERERLRALYLKSLAHLMHYYKTQMAYDKSLTCGQRILGHDPLREEIHREVMRLYLESGQRAMAIRQYRACCQVLEAELGVPPMEETQGLYRLIIRGVDDNPSQYSDRCTPSYPRSESLMSFEQAFQKVHLAMRHFEKAREQLDQAMRYLERLSKGDDFPRAK
jgi:DNA-binding SARP family transcriptional activator